jgi:hypothetical protein
MGRRADMPYQPRPDTSYYEFPNSRAEFRPAAAAQAKPPELGQATLGRPPNPTYPGTPAGYGAASVQSAPPPQEIPQPWRQQWQQYLQQQAAYRQQLAQQLHGLGPYGNALTLPQVQQSVDARRAQMMQVLMGVGGSYGGPAQ